MICHNNSFFFFNLEWTCTIGHDIVLSSFGIKVYPIQLVMTTQFHFRHRPHLYDPSHPCPMWFSLQYAPSLIGHDISKSFSAQTAPVQLVTSLSSLVFITDCIQSYMSRQFSFGFGVDQTYTINHSVVLSSFHHRPHAV